jgi:hypothetical protein
LFEQHLLIKSKLTQYYEINALFIPVIQPKLLLNIYLNLFSSKIGGDKLANPQIVAKI